MALKRTALAGLTLLATFFALLLGPVGAATAAPRDCAPGYPPAQCTIQISATVVPVGGQLSFSAQGFAANETVVATIHSKVVRVGTFQADENGNVSGTVTIPKSVHPRRHKLVLVGQRSGIREHVHFTVIAAAGGHGKHHVSTAGLPGAASGAGGTGGAAGANAAAANVTAQGQSASQLAFTGAEVAGFAGAGVVLIGGGALLLVLARRRRVNAPMGA